MARTRVDELDFRILRALLVAGAEPRSDRERLQEVARQLGVHPNTVAARHRKLLQGRVFLPYTLELDAWRAGIAGGRLFLEVPQERRVQETRDALHHIDGVATILAHLEGWTLLMYAEDEASLDRRGELARRVSGAPRAAWEARLAQDYDPAPPVPLSRLDARLLGALLGDARAAFPRIARSLGVSPRTLERRYRRLAEEGVVSLLPGGSAEVEGMALAYLAAEVREGERARAARGLLALLPNHFLANAAPRARVDFLLYAPSPAELARQAQAARDVDGVRSVTFRLLLEAHPSPHYHDWVRGVLARKAAP